MPDLQATLLDALRRGAPAEALAAAQAAVAQRPGDAAALRALAFAQQATGDITQALDSLDRAIAASPDDANAHFARAGLLLASGQEGDARAALARSTVLDPNLFGAYVLQAQLALSRGDFDEAERLRRLAERIVPAHPQLAAIEGSLALQRGDTAHAYRVLTAALQASPGDPHVGYVLGFTYMAQGHLAFAEQAFRTVRDALPGTRNLHGLIADLMLQQGRPTEALAEIAPLLADPEYSSPKLWRIAGGLELAAGHPERALPHLRASLTAQPYDRATLGGIVEAWQALGDLDDARATLDTILADAGRDDALWRARWAIEPAGSDAAAAVLERWLAALPDSLPALETALAIASAQGDDAAADAIALRVFALDPRRESARTQLFDRLVQHDPSAAIDRCRDWLAGAVSEDGWQVLQGWLAAAQDRAGQADQAVATWSGLQAALAPQRLEPWTPSPARSDWPALGTAAPDATPAGFLFGAPGSAVERIAVLLGNSLAAFRGDRFGPAPPRDAFQKYTTSAALQDGADPVALVNEWRAALPQRGVSNGQVFEWLPYWDNGLLWALRPQLPQGMLLIAVRDPRDMFLDWLAFGAPTPIAMTSLTAAAQWLADVLNQLAALHEQQLYPHRLLRLDDVVDHPQALADLVGAALGLTLPVLPAAAFGLKRFPAGHWRAYAQPLAEPFQLLAPVARRLGYEPA